MRGNLFFLSYIAFFAEFFVIMRFYNFVKNAESHNDWILRVLEKAQYDKESSVILG